ncbi:MAG: GtrA family protein [Gemmatimonadales bacterium]
MRPARFLLVGVSGVAVSMAVLWTAREIVGLSTTWGGTLAWALSTFTNFLLNDAYTWRDRRAAGWRARGRRLLRYYGTTLVGLVISVTVLVFLTDHLGVHLLASNLVAIGAGGTVNYLIHNAWTWRAGRS